MIRVFEPSLGREELDAVAQVFADQWPGTGPRTIAFQKAFAGYLGIEPSELIAVTSCTEGLFQVVEALDLPPDAEVIVPTISFIGAAHAVKAAGYTLRLVDVDPLTLNPLPKHIEQALSKRTKAILLLHFGGRFNDIKMIAELAKANGTMLIEDSACSLGGRHNGTAYGTFGDIGVWSFDAMKLLVTGDGGMMRVSDAALRRRIHSRVWLGGVLPGQQSARDAGSRWWEINPECCGRRSFMNDLAAAIGLAQLPKLDGFIRRRKEIAEAYDHAFNGLSWIRLPPQLSPDDVPYFYWIQMSNRIRDELAQYLRSHDIYTTFRYWPLHLTSLYADGANYPGADRAASETLLLPVHQNLSDANVTRIVEIVRSFSGSLI